MKIKSLLQGAKKILWPKNFVGKIVSVLVVSISTFSTVVNAEVKINFPEEELATESVLPVFFYLPAFRAVYREPQLFSRHPF